MIARLASPTAAQVQVQVHVSPTACGPQPNEPNANPPAPCDTNIRIMPLPSARWAIHAAPITTPNPNL